MMYNSTRDVSQQVSFREALFRGLAPDGGLYVPAEFRTVMRHDDVATFRSLSLLGHRILSPFISDIPSEDLQRIVVASLSFPIPLVPLQDNLFLLELFHGPSLSFKDIGGRFMANALAYYLLKENKKVTILVATSGDTGSAIAHAFYNIPCIDVYILYPSQKISFLQEQQMTTLGKNIHPIEVMGTFDDCQRIVKNAMLDTSLNEQLSLTTANSINISRLLPQMIYHAWSVEQCKERIGSAHPTLVIPSGNLGNLTAAVYAKRIGSPIANFIAATNINAVFPMYLETGQFDPQPSQRSLSNAMDVGHPSNFERLRYFYSSSHLLMRQQIKGVSIVDEDVKSQIKQVYEKTGRLIDPHTAVGVAAAKKNQALFNAPMIVDATAHPAKFPEIIKQVLNIEVELPDRLQKVLNQPKKAIQMGVSEGELKEILRA